MKDRKGMVTAMLVILAVSGAVWATSGERRVEGFGRVLQTYLTSSTRMKINDMFCAGVDRSTMVSQSDVDLKNEYMSHFNLSFTVDG
jgi:hypothetical protein